MRLVPISNVTAVALAKQSAGIVGFIEKVMRLVNPVSLDLFGDSRGILAQQRRDGDDRHSKRELPLNFAAVLKGQVLLVAGNKFTHNNAS